ncbi:hypothetical protein Tco_1498591, partial [Tanacetum coccineum]
MECQVGTLIKNVISLIGRSENVCGISSDMMRQLLPEPPRQEAFKGLMMNFILDQEEKVRQLEEYMCVIGSDFMQLSLEVVETLKKEIKIKENGVKKIEKITWYPNNKDLGPINDHKILEAFRKKVAFYTLDLNLEKG